MSILRYLQNLLAGFSHFINALTGGDASVTWSARLGAEAYYGNRVSTVLAEIIDRLLFSPDHCFEQAVEERLI